MIGRGADKRQPQRHIDPIVKGQCLDRDQRLIVVGANCNVIPRACGGVKHGVGGQGARDVQPFGAQGVQRGDHHLQFLPPHFAAFTCVGVQPRHCDARPVGFLRTATNKRGLVMLQEIARQWRAHGAEYDDLDFDETARLVGAEAYVGAVIDRRGGNIHPLNFALGLAQAAIGAGAVLYGRSRAIGYDDEGAGVSVRTEQGQVKARRALVCTNAYTGPFGGPLGRSVVPVTSVQVATAPLSDNVIRAILPEGHAPTDTRRLIQYYRKTADGRFVMGGRGARGETGTRIRQQELRQAAAELFPQLGAAEWVYAWGGDVAMTVDSLPGLHRLGPNVMAGLGFNGRGVANATVMGTILADWALGVPDKTLDFPVTPVRPIPFHFLKSAGVALTIKAYRLLDKVNR